MYSSTSCSEYLVLRIAVEYQVQRTGYRPCVSTLPFSAVFKTGRGDATIASGAANLEVSTLFSFPVLGSRSDCSGCLTPAFSSFVMNKTLRFCLVSYVCCLLWVLLLLVDSKYEVRSTTVGNRSVPGISLQQYNCCCCPFLTMTWPAFSFLTMATVRRNESAKLASSSITH